MMTIADRIRGTTKQFRAQRVMLGEVEGDLSGGSAKATGGADFKTLAEWMAYLAGDDQAIVYAGANAPSNSWLWGRYTLSGTVTADTTFGVIHTLGLRVIDTSVSAAGIGYMGVDARAGTGRSGTKIGIKARVIATGACDSGDTYAGIVGVLGVTSVSANQNGTGSSYTTHRGNIFGGNSNIFTASGATFLTLVNGHEFNTSLVSGSSAADKYGISIVKGASDAVRGSYDDCAININDQTGASVGWAFGLQFGAYAHQWAFESDSTLIGVKTQTIPSPAASTALYGIDMSALTITAGGAGIVMPLITPASAAATGKAGSIVWDASYIYVCTATDTWKRVAIATWP